MQQLTSPARTAYNIYRWLLDRKDKLAVPLASCRLLLSPSSGEERDIRSRDAQAGLSTTWSPCTLDNFQRMALEWRKAAGSSDENMTFFYFAGHGIRSSNRPSILLLEDFGNGLGNQLSRTVNAYNIPAGMVKWRPKETIAQTQFYFIDACRDYPAELDKFGIMEPSSVFDTPPSPVGKGPKVTLVFAAMPGAQAYGQGGQTVFGKALLQCLNCAVDKPTRSNGQTRWPVLSRTLCDMVRRYVDEQGTEQEVDPALAPRDVVLHYLDERPLVEVVLELNPPQARDLAQVEVSKGRVPVKNWSLPVPIPAHPYQDKIEKGIYNLSARFNPPAPPFKDYEDYLLAELPHQRVKLEF